MSPYLSLIGADLSVLERMAEHGLLPYFLLTEDLAALLVWDRHPELWVDAGKKDVIKSLVKLYKAELDKACYTSPLPHGGLDNSPGGPRVDKEKRIYYVPSHSDTIYYVTLREFCDFYANVGFCKKLSTNKLEKTKEYSLFNYFLTYELKDRLEVEDTSNTHPKERPARERRASETRGRSEDAERVPRSKWPELLTKTDIKKSFDKLTPSQWDYRLDGVLKNAKRKRKDVKAAYFVTRAVTNYLIEENLYSEKQIDQILLNNKLSSPPEGNTRQPETGTKAKPEAKTD